MDTFFSILFLVVFAAVIGFGVWKFMEDRKKQKADKEARAARAAKVPEKVAEAPKE